MAVEITPLGFQKPDGTESIRNGDDVISNNAQRAQDLLADARARVVNLESAAGFSGDPLAMNDSAVAAVVGTPASETNTALALAGYVNESETKGTYADTAARLAGVDSRFAGVDSQFASVDDRFAGVDADFADVSDQLDTINFPAAGTQAVTVGGVRRDVGVYQKYSAFPSVVKLPDTRLYLVWYEATDHVASRDGIVRASYSSDNGLTWGPAFTALSVASKDVRDPCVSVAADGSLYLTYFTGSAANAAEGFFIRKSTDNGLSYGAATRIDTHQYAGGCAPAVPFRPWVETRRNLALDPAATSGINWSNIGGATHTESMDSAVFHEGTTAVKYSVTGSGQLGCKVQVSNPGFAAGDTVRWSVWVRPSVSKSIQPYWERNSPSYQGGNGGPAVTCPANTWTKLEGSVTFTSTQADAAGTFGFGFYSTTAWTAGDVFHADEALVERNVTLLGEFFHGGTPAGGGSQYSWLGTANQSASIQKNESPTESLLATWYGKVLTTDAYDSVWVSTSTNGGTTWAAPTKVVDGIAAGMDMQEPWATFQGENVVITYRRGNSANIGVVKSANSGTTWGAGVTAFPGTGRPGTVLTKEGTLVCVYRSLGSALQQHGMVRTSRDLGTTWTGPRLVEPTVSNFWVYSGLVENSPGQVLCVSAVESSTTSTQMSSRYLTEGSGISPFGDVVPPQAHRAIDRLRYIAAVDDFDHPARTFADGDRTIDGKRWSTDGSATITDGQLQDAAANGAHVHWLKTLVTSHEVEAEMHWTANAGIALLCRVQDTSNYLMATLESGGAAARIYKVVAGTATQLATATVSYPSGVWHKYRFSAVGNNLKFYIEDTLVASVTDATFNNQGGAGIRTGSASIGTIHKVRNFIATRRTEINT